MPDAATVTLLGHHAVALQDVAHRRTVRQLPAAVTLVHQDQELLATPARMTAPRLKQRGDDLLGGLVRRRMWPSRSFLQSARALPQVTLHPLLAHLPPPALP